jgi:hypothetical protein
MKPDRQTDMLCFVCNGVSKLQGGATLEPLNVEFLSLEARRGGRMRGEVTDLLSPLAVASDT